LDDVQVDTTTLGLLAVLLLVPLAPFITHLSAAGVEARIGPQEAQELQESAADLPAAPETEDEPPADAPSVQELIDRDPPLGLAKLRIDLEREIRAIYEQKILGGPGRGRSLGLMTRDLVDADALPPEIAGPLMDVNGLANRAVHGEYVPRDVAEEIADVGLRVLSALRSLRELSKPDSSSTSAAAAPQRQ
jgi:hypothetical protein